MDKRILLVFAFVLIIVAVDSLRCYECFDCLTVSDQNLVECDAERKVRFRREAGEINSNESTATTPGTTNEPIASPPTTPGTTNEPITTPPTTPGTTNEPIASPPTTPAITNEPIASLPTTPGTTNEPIASPPTTPGTTNEPIASPPATSATTKEPIASPPTTSPTTKEPIASQPTTFPTTNEPITSPPRNYYCYKVTVNNNGTDVIQRGCAVRYNQTQESCDVPVNMIGRDCKACEEDKCNGAVTKQLSFIVFVIMLSLTVKL